MDYGDSSPPGNMEGQDGDGISVRPMRLKVLYTFDDESKTNCLARWPHILDIQTAFLDEQTQVGVIELRTCIQAIVSASPELVAKLGHDYTVYAYDYSEYETPLVGQGMLSWVLASSSPTPDAPAHQSKTMVTGRVCKNMMGLFSKTAQETLEVKLRLVPVPTVVQSEYLNSMHKYREMSNVMSPDFDSSAWKGLSGNSVAHPSPRTGSPVDQSGIERFHQILSASATPREFPAMHTAESVNADSPPASTIAPPSRTSTPGFQQRSSSSQQQNIRRGSEAPRPSSRASAREIDVQPRPQSYHARRGSMQSGYGSGDDMIEAPARKRAKVFRAEWPDKMDLNIDKQPGSLRVAASTAASVRIHRPMPVNPAALAQGSNEEPIRPPTPVPRVNDASRRARPVPSGLRRASSSHSNGSSASSVPVPDDHRVQDINATSPDDVRCSAFSDTPFNIPSSPPVMENNFPQTSSPGLPPLSEDHDSGFIGGALDSFLDDDHNAEKAVDQRRTGYGNSRGQTRDSSPVKLHPNLTSHTDNFLTSDAFADASTTELAPQLPPPVRTSAGSRPSSRASYRSVRQLAPAPISQSEVEQQIREAGHQLRQTVPASDPVHPPQPLVRSQTWAGPMSDFPTPTDNPVPVAGADISKVRGKLGARQTKQVQARLEKCIREGAVPPFCDNCGAIETPTWRRAWSKVIHGSEDEANALVKDQTLFWEPNDKNDDGKVASFKIFKKSLAKDDNDFEQILLCNPCGLWLHKFKAMRPENKWNKSAPKDNKRKRPSRVRSKGSAEGTAVTRSKSLAASHRHESSPGPTEMSSPGEDGTTPGVTPGVEADNEENDDENSQGPSYEKIRANSVQPELLTESANRQWDEGATLEALRRAIQSSPARNMEARTRHLNPTTPESVKRTLFPSSREGEAMRTLGEALTNSVRKSPRYNSTVSQQNPDDGASFEMGPLGSPTPKRRSPRRGNLSERMLAATPSTPAKTSEPLKNRGASKSSPSKSIDEQKTSPRKPSEAIALDQDDSDIVAKLDRMYENYDGPDPVMREIFGPGAQELYNDDSLPWNQGRFDFSKTDGSLIDELLQNSEMVHLDFDPTTFLDSGLGQSDPTGPKSDALDVSAESQLKDIMSNCTGAIDEVSFSSLLQNMNGENEPSGLSSSMG